MKINGHQNKPNNFMSILSMKFNKEKDFEGTCKSYV